MLLYSSRNVPMERVTTFSHYFYPADVPLRRFITQFLLHNRLVIVPVGRFVGKKYDRYKNKCVPLERLVKYRILGLVSLRLSMPRIHKHSFSNFYQKNLLK